MPISLIVVLSCFVTVGCCCILHADVRAGYRQKVSCFLGNSFVMVQYKTFDLKHYIVFVKIGPPTGQITFLAV